MERLSRSKKEQLMPWRLILFLVVLTLVVLFAGFNLNNRADISFGFWTLAQVPIFLSLFIAFLAGCFVMLPFAARRRSAKESPQSHRQVKQDGEPQPLADEAPPTSNTGRRNAKRPRA